VLACFDPHRPGWIFSGGTGPPSSRQTPPDGLDQRIAGVASTRTRARQGQPHRRHQVKTVIQKKEKQKQNTGQKAIAGREPQTAADEA
jgi:hypothetical protein